MAPEGSGGGGSRNGATAGAMMRSGGGGRQALKKGPWTAAEDSILTEYVKKHGEGNWNAVQRNSGLMRCGKSCRLRWANHLRPNLKKGAFSAEEERLIIELHSKIGNKWARMASQLPGRTDNEIKNYWNTRMKRRHRAGLPLYPQEIQQKHQNDQQQKHEPINSSSSSSLSSLLSPSSSSSPHQLQETTYNYNYNYNYSNPSLSSLFNQPADLSSNLNPTNSYYIQNRNQQQFKLFRDNNGGLSLSLSSSSSAPLYNPCSFSSEIMPTVSSQLPFGALVFDVNSNSRPNMGGSLNQLGLVVSNSGLELPSIQSPALTYSGTGSDYVMMARTMRSSDGEKHDLAPNFSQGNSGLLEDLLEESHALKRIKKPENEKLSLEDEGDGKKFESEDGFMEGSNIHSHGVVANATPEKPIWDESNPTFFSNVMKTKKDASDEMMNSMDEDLKSLLDFFPLAVPATDWYEKNGADAENPRETSGSPVTTATTTTVRNHHRAMGSCCWNNMPTIF